MTSIKGIAVRLHVKTQTGVDAFNRPVYIDSIVDVDNVLVSPVSSSSQTDRLNVTGFSAAYELCIPKDDTHSWENTIVEFFGQKWSTVGIPQEYICKLVPLDWNKKVMVKRNEQNQG